MADELFEVLKKHKEKAIILFLALCVLDVSLYIQISGREKNRDLSLHFLGVGQGDSELVMLPGGVKVLIDGGPINGKALSELSKILPGTDRYIDLVVMSHPQTDHFGGLIDVLKDYSIGAFLWSGREGTATSFMNLKEVMAEKGIRDIRVGKGDRIDYENNVIQVLAPWKSLMNSKELNDTTVVLELESKNTKTLFTGDIGSKIEDQLVADGLGVIDILKVAHHGSKYSSPAEFLKTLHPKLSVIEVGKNSYGHPTKEALQRIGAIGSSLYRTDEYGTVSVVIDGKAMRVYRP